MHLQVVFIDAWRRQSSWLKLLLPLEIIYRSANYLDRVIKTKILQRHSLRIPLVVVGSIALGGAGKTPAVISLVKEFTKRGFKVGIISRGYKGDAKKPTEVSIASNPAEVGDEPLLIACSTDCPVFIGSNRYLVARTLMARHKVDVIVSDDGLQHYRLAAEIEVAMIDQAMGLSNGHCLPVGPLREPHDRLTRVDFVVVNQTNPVPVISPKDSSKKAASQVNLDSIIKDLHTKGLTKGHTKIYNKIHFMERKSISCIKLDNHNLANLRASGCSIAEWQKSLCGKQVHAIAGIAQPQNFFNLLQEQGVAFTPHIFANHHKFSVAELNFGKDKVIIMTEKDAIKCSEFNELDNLWALRINHELESSLISEIVAQL